MPDKAIEVLLDEKRNFPPPKQFKKSANVRSASIFNLARKGNPRSLPIAWTATSKGWSLGGKLNGSYIYLDRHSRR